MKALLVDDDIDLLDVTTYALRREGYTVVAAVDGQQALLRWEAERPDIVLLDGKLPKLDGFEVCRRIRQTSHTPIIMLTARAQEEDVVRGFRLGADDYVTKPFSASVLRMRIEALLRRTQLGPYAPVVGELRTTGGLVLELQSHEVTQAGRPVRLTRLEFRILYKLAMNEGRVVSYDSLVEYAWGYDGGDASLLKTHISHIRSKLGLVGDRPGGIRNVSGVGYSLTRADKA
ncbi:MAG: response regulator transcription factor [Chloroflexota bacterium]|nr:response regulator transcription factor [Chloroflexota bacterium]